MNQEEMITQIEATLQSLRPYLQADGGDVAFLNLTPEMVVQVKLLGSCESCNMSTMTMRFGIEKSLKRVLPLIKDVEAITEADA